MKSSQPRRDWAAARTKVEAEGRCRLGWAKDCDGPLEAAHIVGREVDLRPAAGNLQVEPARIVPLCRRHHGAYDRHEVDVLSALTLAEQAQAVLDAGGIELARIRTCPSAYRSEGIKAYD